MEEEIIDLLQKKASTKQAVYSITQSIFLDLQNILKKKSKRISDLVTKKDKRVEISYASQGKFGAQIKFSGETLLFHMHSNVFDFPSTHPVHKTKYVKEDSLRAFCGVIHVYNFLSDSLKYNRVNDSGFLIARIFINKDSHFFVEGDRELGFLFNDFINEKIDSDKINRIVDMLMIYALNFDLQTPNFNDIREVFVHQILDMSNIQKIKTSKRMGYKFSFETNNE
mgnify:FL=1|tara:strand:- start:105 stop:779 length:675 start_codon:yes stop_codon:yes gene_type:complete